jgi:hypothetical protein
MTEDRAEFWRQLLDHALGKPERSLVLADMDHQSAMLSVRCTEPRHLLQMARMLVDQARDAFDGMEGDQAEDMVLLCDDVLGLLPDPDAEAGDV